MQPTLRLPFLLWQKGADQAECHKEYQCGSNQGLHVSKEKFSSIPTLVLFKISGGYFSRLFDVFFYDSRKPFVDFGALFGKSGAINGRARITMHYGVFIFIIVPAQKDVLYIRVFFMDHNGANG
jgi:hypothetical protein